MRGEPEHRTLFEGARRLTFIRPSPVFSSCGYLVNTIRSQLLTRTSQLHYSTVSKIIFILGSRFDPKAKARSYLLPGEKFTYDCHYRT